MLALCDPSNLLFKKSFYPPRSDTLFSNYFEDLLIHVFLILSLLLAICRPSGCTMASGIVGVFNCSQMRTSKCTCLIFGVSIVLDPGYKCTKGIFDRSKFKVTHDISPTISGWLLVLITIDELFS